MLPSWCRDVLRVRRAPLVPSRGGEARDWARATTHEVGGCSVQMGTSDSFDPIARPGGTSTSATCYAPPGSDIRAGDRVAFGGATFEVDGDPLPQRSPFGGCDHILVRLRHRRG